MKIVSVNIAQPRPIKTPRSTRKTGIYKTPIDHPVCVTALGLEGDAVCNTKHHGGVDQAVYVFCQPDYDWWAAELGLPLPPGTFGENLTVSELESTVLSIGDRLHADEITLEVTSPRIPCATLAARMGDTRFVKRFRQGERPGFYCRVIREGHVRAGETLRLERHAGDRIGVLEMFRDFYVGAWDEAMLRRYLAAPIAIRDRRERARQLAELLDG